LPLDDHGDRDRGDKSMTPMTRVTRLGARDLLNAVLDPVRAETPIHAGQAFSRDNDCGAR
jgi:hypothetical protein